jgi:hypothetical protein
MISVKDTYFVSTTIQIKKHGKDLPMGHFRLWQNSTKIRRGPETPAKRPALCRSIEIT